MHTDRQKSGFTLLELLVLLAIIGIVAIIGVFSGRLVAAGQERSSFLAALEQLFSRGASAAASRGKPYALNYDGNKLIIAENGGTRVAYVLEVPLGIDLSLPTGVQIVEFQAPGRVKALALPADCNGARSFTVRKSGEEYCYRVSIIGDVEVTP